MIKKDRIIKLEDDEIFILGISMTKGEMIEMLKSGSEYKLDIFKNDDIFENESEDQNSEINENLQNVMNTLKKLLLRNLVEDLRDKVWKEEDIKEFVTVEEE